jgi:hypothetical protein
MQKVGTPGSGLEHDDYCSTGRLIIWMKGAPSVIVAVRVPISPPIVVAVRAIIQMDTKVVSMPMFAPLVLTPFTTLESLVISVVVPRESCTRVQHRKCSSENHRWQSKSLQLIASLFSC